MPRNWFPRTTNMILVSHKTRDHYLVLPQYENDLFSLLMILFYVRKTFWKRLFKWIYQLLKPCVVTLCGISCLTPSFSFSFVNMKSLPVQIYLMLISFSEKTLMKTNLDNSRSEKLLRSTELTKIRLTFCHSFSIFSIVNFPNEVCKSSNGDNGTCLTAPECSSRSGVVSGSCASGFGACCLLYNKLCGGTLEYNNTYIL